MANPNDTKPTSPPMPGPPPANLPPGAGGVGGNVYEPRPIVQPNTDKRPGK